MAHLNRLTSRQFESLKKDGVYADGGGLYVRVRGPAKHFLFIYTVEGRRREMGLGAPPAVGLRKARERAQAARELLADGNDPIAVKRAGEAVPTFGSMADKWVEGRKSSVRNEKSVDRWKRVLGEQGYAAALRPLRVDRVRTEDVLLVLEPIWSKGATATLARGYIEAVLDAAKAKGHRSGENPARWRGHLDHLLPRPGKLQRGHHAAMDYRDIPGFMASLRQRQSIVARLLEFTILTAARSGEALGATWSELDLDAGFWRIPAARTKAGRPHEIPLSPRARQIIESLKGEAADPGSHVFADDGRPLSNMAGSMLLRRMDAKVTVHGFRSTFRDWAGDRTRFPREVAEAALGHSIGSVEAAYRRGTAIEKRRDLMAAWDRYCGSQSPGALSERATKLPHAV